MTFWHNAGMNEDSHATRLSRRLVSSHLWRTFDRYFNRLGNQLAASIAFFTILAVVPLIMFAFSALGFTLTVIRPQWLAIVQIQIVEHIYAGPLQDQILVLVSKYLYDWQSVGLIALAMSLFIGASWVANLKCAIRGMSRPDANISQPTHNIVLEFIINTGLVFVMIMLAAVTFITTTIGTQLVEHLVDLLKVSNVHISASLLRVSSFGVSLICATLLFYLIYRFLPEVPLNPRAVRRGSFGAAFMFVILQAGAGLLTRFFALGRAAQVLGPVIIVMILINLIAQLTLGWMAWIATWDQPAIAGKNSDIDHI